MFQIVGAVENWLGAVNNYQRNIETNIGARGSAANWELVRPREKWISDYPAQLALASQIYWTEETESALEELEVVTKMS